MWIIDDQFMIIKIKLSQIYKDHCYLQEIIVSYKFIKLLSFCKCHNQLQKYIQL